MSQNVSASGISIVGGKGGSYRANGLLFLLLLLVAVPRAGVSPATQVLLRFGRAGAASTMPLNLGRSLSMRLA